MAGDWMKIELELPDKQEVHAIANQLNIDPDAVVGKLIRVWQWFDKHTTDGNAYGVTYSLVDRITSITGFGEAMSFVGWLEQNDKVLTMPKFDRHTSNSAKTRALTANRVQKKRNADVTMQALPREEKRRDISTSLTQLPDDFTPCETAVQTLRAAGISVQTELEKFRDHAKANGKLQIDWHATFRTWARNAVDWAKPKQASPPRNKTAVDRQIDMANAMFGDLVNGRRRTIDISQDGAEGDRPPVLVAGNCLR